MNTTCLHTRGGWSPEETELLLREATAAEKAGAPVKSVFDKVAQATGRKPNSIRNYYYLKMKENTDLARASFVPFTREEVDALLRTMLTQQADGRSVRGIALEMGGGDKKAMLRYQNKYRSALRTDPQRVRRIMNELRTEGAACIDPFIARRRKHRDLSAMISELMQNFAHAQLDPEPLFYGLSELAKRAGEAHNDELLGELSAAKQENMALRERCGALCAACRSFVEKNASERLNCVNAFAAELERIMG